MRAKEGCRDGLPLAVHLVGHDPHACRPPVTDGDPTARRPDLPQQMVVPLCVALVAYPRSDSLCLPAVRAMAQGLVEQA